MPTIFISLLESIRNLGVNYHICLFIKMKLKNPHLYYLILLNLGMLFISTSGVLGRYIELSPPLTIWYRSLFAILLLGTFCLLKKYSFKIDWKNHGKAILLSGVFMALHWVTYFFALQWSNVTIGMLSLFTYPIFTVLLEPFFVETKLQSIHLLFGLMILTGIYFLVPAFDVKNTETQGLLMGIFSAIVYALRNLILKSHSNMASGSIQMFYQMGVVLFILLPVLWIYPQENIASQLPYLLILGGVTTALGHTLFLTSFSHFKISTASIMSSIQPIFGMILALIFLHEIPNLKSLIGGLLILTTVVLESQRSKKKNK